MIKCKNKEDKLEKQKQKWKIRTTQKYDKYVDDFGPADAEGSRQTERVEVTDRGKE